MAGQVTQNEQRQNKQLIKGDGNLPENGAGVPLHSKILAALKKKVEKMFEEAVEDPRSDANELVHVLLLDQLTNMPTSGAELKTILGQEQRRQSAKVHWKLSMGRERRVRKMDRQRRALMQEQLKVARQKAKDARRKAQEAGRIAKEARRAAEQGEPMDALEVYNRIAEIVGLRVPTPPLKPKESQEQAADSRQ